MAKQLEKSKALKLRKKGKSISVIAKELQISKSTVSHWCKDIKLTKEQISHIAKESQHRATASLLLAAEVQRDERIKNIERERRVGAKRVGSLTNRDVYMVGLGLYWGEGYKKGSQEFGFTNSDPNMILFYLRWLKMSFNIERDQLILRVSINQYHKPRESEVLQYWSELIEVPESQFTKTSFIKTNAKKLHYTERHYGTLRVKVRKGTFLRHQVLGSIEHLT